MKKRKLITSLLLVGALSFGSLGSVSAATYPDSGIKETQVEKTTYTFINEVNSGKYKLVDTTTLKSWVDKKEKMIIVDTMPASSYNESNGHIPGAINSVAPMTTNEYTDAQKADLDKQLNSLLPNKTEKKTTWKKVSKKTYKKLAKSQRKAKKVKKGKKTKTYYYKKIVKTNTVKDKSYKIVVYCGHIGCARSHVVGAYLVSKGYTNVYRYGGGITAWIDAGYSVDKNEATAETTAIEESTEATPEAVTETPAEETTETEATTEETTEDTAEVETEAAETEAVAE